MLAECVLCPFVGDCYEVRCPSCEMHNICRFSDGASLRHAPLRQCCDIGHVFRVRIDAPPCVFARVCFSDDVFHQDVRLEDEAPPELPASE